MAPENFVPDDPLSTPKACFNAVLRVRVKNLGVVFFLHQKQPRTMKNHESPHSIESSRDDYSTQPNIRYGVGFHQVGVRN